MPPAYFNPVVVCQETGKVASNGLWLGDNPLSFSSPLFMMQLSMCAIVMAILHGLLQPFGQCSFVSQMIGGILLGPSVQNLNNQFLQSHVVTDQALYVIRTFQYFGFMFFVFLVGLKTDMGVLMRSGRKVALIGLSSYIFPILVTIPMTYLLKYFVNMDPKLGPMLPFVAVFECSNSFHNIVCLLSELKLLNCELGRLAVCSSMVSGMCSWAAGVLVLLTKQSLQGNADESMWMILSFVLMIVCVVYVLRPIMLWIINKTPEGERIREFYVFIIFLMILITALFGEISGQHFLFGPILLGVAVPPGPPLASALEDKFNLIITTVLLPLYYVSHGTKVDIHEINLKNFVIVQFISFFALVGKIIGTILPSLYCEISLQDAVWLGVILSAQGIIDLTYFRRAVQLKLIDEEVSSIMVLWAMFITAVIAPLLLYTYRPSKRYKGNRRTLPHIKSNSELRILACVYQEANVPTIINLLEASNPTRDSPIFIYLLHLIELQGLAAPLLVNHQKSNKKDHSLQYNHSKHIINAFKFFEQHNRSIVSVNSFTSITSFPTMHADVCSLAMDKKTNLIILPFHRQRNIDGILESSNSIRNMNQQVLRMAPCTVAVLVERGNSGGGSQCVLGGKALYRVAVVFMGGGDDREALVLAGRMAEHSSIQLTVVRLVVRGDGEKEEEEMRRDEGVVNEFRVRSCVEGRVEYREEEIRDGEDTIRVVRGLEEEGVYELVVVGRQHGVGGMRGLRDWNEFPELGFIGDMLASSEREGEGAVLVVQHEMLEEEEEVMPITGDKANFAGV